MSDVGVCGGAGGSTDGDVLIFNRCGDIRVLAHEIGHGCGLQHNFRDDTYVMNYGTKERLSVGAANWLNRHLAFNESTMEFPWTLDVNSKALVDADRLVFKVRAHLNPCLSKA